MSTCFGIEDTAAVPLTIGHLMIQLGLSMADLELLSIGLINDMYAESRNDDYAITGFGLAAKDSSRVADLMTQAANLGTIGISDLGESYKYVAPLAQSMGRL